MTAVADKGRFLRCDVTNMIVNVGDVRVDFRGENHVIKGGYAPRNEGSTGRVETDHGLFYPGVVSCHWTSEIQMQIQRWCDNSGTAIKTEFKNHEWHVSIIHADTREPIGFEDEPLVASDPNLDAALDALAEKLDG